MPRSCDVSSQGGATIREESSHPVLNTGMTNTVSSSGPHTGQVLDPDNDGLHDQQPQPEGEDQVPNQRLAHILQQSVIKPGSEEDKEHFLNQGWRIPSEGKANRVKDHLSSRTCIEKGRTSNPNSSVSDTGTNNNGRQDWSSEGSEMYEKEDLAEGPKFSMDNIHTRPAALDIKEVKLPKVNDGLSSYNARPQHPGPPHYYHLQVQIFTVCERRDTAYLCIGQPQWRPSS